MFAMLISATQVHPDGNCEYMGWEDFWENLTVKGFPDKKTVIGGKGRKGKREGKRMKGKGHLKLKTHLKQK